MATKKNEETVEKEPPKRSVSALQIWIEDAWEGWLKSVGTLLLFALAYVLYKFDLVGEGLAGVVLVLAVIGGSLGSVALPAWPLVQTQAQKALFITVMIVAAAATGYPAMHAAVPPKALAETRLTVAQPSTKVHVDGDGPYELSVGGTFKTPTGEAEVSYTLKVTGSSGSDEVSGEIKRSLMRMRTRKGSSTSLQERTENVHRLPTVRGGDLTLTVDGVDEQLADGLHIDVRPAGPNPLLFILLGVLAIVGALALDARLTDGKGRIKSYLAVGVGICFGFALYFPEEATPHSLVRPAVSALVVGLAAGGIGGWVLGALARMLFGPKLKKARK